ncbi:MAG: hypothetical protein CMJ78_13655 [Planctomycetaceae bacterium]|nr:hypothetical protein [Planctomycetaceae bacterium]
MIVASLTIASYRSALALDKSPSPVSRKILDNPKPEHVRTLISALNGCGCVPKHHPVRDALVKIGKPAASPLIKRMNSTTKWWIQLECVYILGLIGPEAGVAEELRKANIRHPLPKRYLGIARTAMLSDSEQLRLYAKGKRFPGSSKKYVQELLALTEQRAKAKKEAGNSKQQVSSSKVDAK